MSDFGHVQSAFGTFVAEKLVSDTDIGRVHDPLAYDLSGRCWVGRRGILPWKRQI
jgi:hypothetical protein